MMHFEVKTDLPFQFQNSQANRNNFTDEDDPIKDGRRKAFKYLTNEKGAIQNGCQAPSTIESYEIKKNNKTGFRLDLQTNRNYNKMFSLQQNGEGHGHNYGTLVFEFFNNGSQNNDPEKRKEMIKEIVKDKYWKDNTGTDSVVKRIDEFGTEVYKQAGKYEVVCRIRINMIN